MRWPLTKKYICGHYTTHLMKRKPLFENVVYRSILCTHCRRKKSEALIQSGKK